MATGDGLTTSFSRHAQTLLYESFLHAQGSQVMQVHLMHAYLLMVRQEGIAMDFSLRETLATRIRSRRLPRGHLDIVDLNLIAAQFEFWWLNMWDICSAILAGPTHLPTRDVLEQRMTAVGGSPEMSSFTDDELSAVADAFGTYRNEDYSDALVTRVVNDHLLPNLIRVEMNFQGYGSRYAERPRTDGGDVHESKMIGHCATAVRRARTGPVDPFDRIYLAVNDRLDWLSRYEPESEVLADYRRLIAAHATNH